MVAAAKLPVLNPGEFELWKMRIEQYFLMTDYALWEVIVNGDSPPPKRTIDGVEKDITYLQLREKVALSRIISVDKESNSIGNVTQVVMAVLSCGSVSEALSLIVLKYSQVSDKFKTGVGYDSQVFDSQVFDSQVNDKYKTGEGYHVVPPPYTGNFMPPKPDLVLADKDEYVFSESVTSVPAVATSEVKTSESKPKSVSEPLIEDWISDSENENETEFKSRQRKPSNAKVKFVKSNEHVKSPRESVKKVENNKQAEYPRKNSQSPRELQEKGVIDSGCFRHMTGNMSYLSDYEEIDGGFVAFGGNPKGGKITRKRCPVTILNTLDHLGKFDGKANEGFFVGYSVNSKEFRTPDSPISSSLKRSDNEVADDVGKKSTKDPANEGDKDDQDLRDEFEREFESSPINTDGTKDANDEPMMPNLEDTGIFGDAYDDEDFVARGDMNNLESSMSVSPIVTTRVHKDHPVKQIIGDLHSAPQTRRMTKNSKEHGLVSLI
ncbi:hypothetical protein Tco_0385982 [Tanacetum coccineum]